MKNLWAVISVWFMAIATPDSLGANLAESVKDPAGLLSPETIVTIADAMAEFGTLTGRRMTVIVVPKGPVPDLDELSPFIENPDPAKKGAGIVYAASPDDPAGRLFMIDPSWQKSLPGQWRYMFPQRLAQKYGAEPFERRVVLSAQYLATVFPDKVAFVLKPRGGTLSEGSLKFSRSAYVGIEILIYFIILFTAFRTLWPARLRDEDQDDFRTTGQTSNPP